MDWIDRKGIKDSLKELADKSYQGASLDGFGAGVMSTPDEVVCRLFNDSGLDIAYNKGRAVYGEEIDDKLKELGSLVEKLPYDSPPMKLIEDERMIPVRKMAADILNLIERQGNSA